MLRVLLLLLLLRLRVSGSDWDWTFGHPEDLGWTHRTVLDGAGRYHVSWTPRRDKQDIVFKVEVEAHGYVALGLSPNGGMAGSDIVTAWVTDGMVYLQDRNAKGHWLPDVDSRQDWMLITGWENDTHTVVYFRRKLQTCDPDDRPIDSSTTRMIYSFSDTDPDSAYALRYHGSRNRGSKSVPLLESNVRHVTDKSGLYHWDLLSPNATLTDERTQYWCKFHRAPDLAVKHHVVLIEPLIRNGYVHHMLLYECSVVGPDEFERYGDSACHDPDMPDLRVLCDAVYTGWSVGAEELVLPDNVGLPLGPSSPKYYMLEIHYDNPSRHTGVTDASGFRFYYTPELRRFDAGAMKLGSMTHRMLIVPPGQKDYVVVGHSNPKCFEGMMPPGGIKVMGAFLHSHLLCRRIKVRHFRGSRELPPLADDRNFDYNYQGFRQFRNEVAVLPGDQMSVECTYDSSERRTVTLGGAGTKEEMCLAYFMYYPKLEWATSVSIPAVDLQPLLGIQYGNLYEFTVQIQSVDWSRVNVRELQKVLRYGTHQTRCTWFDGPGSMETSVMSYPDHLQPYETPDDCANHRFWTRE